MSEATDKLVEVATAKLVDVAVESVAAWLRNRTGMAPTAADRVDLRELLERSRVAMLVKLRADAILPAREEMDCAAEEEPAEPAGI